MTPDPLSFGFNVIGSVQERRVPVPARDVFKAYADLDPRIDPTKEAYLSAFQFGNDFRDHMRRIGSPKGFDGECWSPWLWFDIDRTNLDEALRDARGLVTFLLLMFTTLDEDDLLIFFSGGKGFHVGVPMGHREPSTHFHLISRRLAERIAEERPVAIDSLIYDRVRCFRAPNSRHPQTGLHKRRLMYRELMELSIEGIIELAKHPVAFEIPEAKPDETLQRYWREAEEAVNGERERKREIVQTTIDNPRLTRATRDFIREGAEEGERTNRLFRAAAELTEFGSPPSLVRGLLTDPARDSGMMPQEIERVILCGIDHAMKQKGGES